MTLIIAKQCKDGIVLAADRRELRGLEPKEGHKIREVTIHATPQNFTLLLAGAGVGSFWEEVARYMGQSPDTETLPPFKNLTNVITGLSTAVIELSKIYQSEGLDDKLGCVVAGLEDLRSGKAKMYSFAGAGFAETGFICLGSGAKYALPMADVLLNTKDITTEKAASFMPLLFLLVERVNLSVNGGPDIFIVNYPAPESAGRLVGYNSNNLSCLISSALPCFFIYSSIIFLSPLPLTVAK